MWQEKRRFKQQKNHLKIILGFPRRELEVCSQSLFLSHHWNVLTERLKILPAFHPGLFAPRKIWISGSPASSGKAPWPPQRPRQWRGRPGEMLQLREGGTKCWKIPRERKGWHRELPFLSSPGRLLPPLPLQLPTKTPLKTPGLCLLVAF